MFTKTKFGVRTEVLASWFRKRVGGGLVLLILAIGLQGGPALAVDKYKPSNAGQPLRVAAYVVHPVGVVFDFLVLRPAYWVGSYEPFKTMFGRTD